MYLFYIGYQFNLMMNDDLSLREADVQPGVIVMIIEETGKLLRFYISIYYNL